jgi:hypothetical protein
LALPDSNKREKKARHATKKRTALQKTIRRKRLRRAKKRQVKAAPEKQSERREIKNQKCLHRLYPCESCITAFLN